MPSSISEADRQLFQQQPQVPVQSVPSFVNSVNSYSMANSNVAYPNSLMPRSPIRNSFKSGQSVTIAPNPTATIQVPPALTTETNPETIACAMASADSGLDVRDRMWLKIRIPNAFIGSDVVLWLHAYVQGFHDRKEAKKFAGRKLLKQGYIQHTINLKSSFSEKCYYIFSDLITQKVLGANLVDVNSANQHANLTGLEDGFSNGLRLTNENFQQQNTIDQSSFNSITGQQFAAAGKELASSAANPGQAANQAKPGMYMMPFMRYWDETSEIHNYGLFGPTQADIMANSGLNDGNGSHHSG